MKRCLLVPILLGVFFMVGAAPAVSSAANCAAKDNPMFWNGVLNYRAQLYNCSGVDYVQFGWPNNHWHGWADYSLGLEIGAYDSYGGGQPIVSGGTVSDNYWYYSYCGGANHIIAAHYSFRIHAIGGQFGPWHDYLGATYHILC